MTFFDPSVLAAVGLGLDAAAFGWHPGVGLRWSLPVGSVIHDPGVNLNGQPRGWPDNGFRIYRSDVRTIEVACVDLTAMNRDRRDTWAAPVALLPTDLTVDWVALAGNLSLGESLGQAGRFTVYCNTKRLGLRLKFESTRGTQAGDARRRPKGRRGRMKATAYDARGAVVARVERQWHGVTNVLVSGPGIARVDVKLANALVVEACTLTAPSGPSGRPIHIAYPLTSRSAILASPIASRLDMTADWSAFASYTHDARANIDARLAVAPATTNPAASPTAASDSALVDLLLLFAVDPGIAWLLGLLWWDTTAAVGREYLYWVAAEWGGVEYSWPVGPIGPKPPRSFDLPADLQFTGTVLPALPTTDDNGLTGGPATAAGLSWRTGNVPSGSDPAPVDVAARWRVGRLTLPFGTPSSTVASTLAGANSFSPIAANDIIDVDPAQAPPYLARDSGFAEGDQWWELTGVDVFGRLSSPVRVGPLSVWDERVPPPPDRVTARWLDAAGASPATAPADPLLTEQDVAWLAANPQASSGALFVGWEWPPSSEAMAPGVREFRLYAQPANLVPRLSGTITAVTSVPGSPQYSDVNLDAALPPSREPFVGGTLRDGRGTFPIVELATPNETANRVRVVNTPDSQPSSPPPSGAPYGTPSLLQSLDPPTYSVPEVGAKASAIADIRPARAWPERLAIVPKLSPLPTSISSVLADQIIGDSRYVTVRLANPLVHPDPSGGVYADSGSLVLGNDEYRARLVTLDPNRSLPNGFVDVTLSMPKTDTTTFPAGASVVFHPGTSVYLPHQSFRPAASLREYALVSVTAANNSSAPAAVDDPVHASDTRWQENNASRHGFESATASPVTIIEVSRTPPAAPPQPVSPLLTTWPDAAGTATFTLTWPPQPGLRYVVLRAADETLCSVDRVERKAPYGNYAAAHPNLAALSATYPDTDPQLPDYAAVFASVGGAAVMAEVASIDENARAFTPRMGAPQGVADCTAPGASRTIATTVGVEPTSEPGLWLDVATGNLVYTDTLPGIGTTRYFYRILAVDAVGNRSSLSPSTLPVVTRVSALPRPPAITASRFGDCAITLLWHSPADDSVDRYLVYRAATPQELVDVHELTPEVVDAPRVMLGTDLESDLPLDSNIPLVGAPPALPPGLPAGVTEWGWIGADLPPVDMYVAVVAEKDIPNGAPLRSAPTAPLHVRPIEYGTPDPPQLTALDRSGPDGGHLEFSLDRPWHKLSIEIRGPGDRVWRSMTGGFVSPSASGAFDFAADTGVRYAIRLRVQNGIGLMSAATQGSLA